MLAAHATTRLRLPRIVMSWRIRWPYLVGLLSLLALLAGARLARWQYKLRVAYAETAWQLEDPDLPVSCVAGWIGIPHDRPDGTREIAWPGGFMDSGPVQDGRATGVWSMRGPDGNVRRTVTKYRDENDGPCEFWVATRTKHVTGSYRGGQRAGLWKLENVLGRGTTYLWFGL